MLLSLLKKRRSKRRFLEKNIEEEKIKDLIRAALLSPTSKNSRPWEFIIVREENTLMKLAGAKPHGGKFLGDAAAGIVVCADPEKSDVWVEDASIASINIQLAAEDIGLGSCWIQIRKRKHDKSQTAGEYIKQLLGIPGKYRVESIIALGYSEEDKEPHSEEDLQYEKIHFESFNS